MDDFGPDAVLDLRKLNERIAGQDGFIQREGDNAGGNRSSVDYLARRLAKIGVNTVRYHSPIFNIAAPVLRSLIQRD